MARFGNFVIRCVLAAGSIAASVAPAAAFTPPAPHHASASDIQSATHRNWHGRPYDRRPYYNDRRYYRPGVNIYIAPRPVYRERYIRRGSHVDWCLARYRSYNPATNRYLSSSGVYRICRSPY